MIIIGIFLRTNCKKLRYAIFSVTILRRISVSCVFLFYLLFLLLLKNFCACLRYSAKSCFYCSSSTVECKVTMIREISEKCENTRRPKRVFLKNSDFTETLRFEQCSKSISGVFNSLFPIVINFHFVRFVKTILIILHFKKEKILVCRHFLMF